ncbi:hypothetical protein SAMN05445871_5799 [Paraburkholderia caballeronis]|uniref:Uncharacterized protein n=1 Tax=Paraburkholderia caballeronis TaxID=416943 RepID=A0A1H7FVL4_9BURK|nr:hypothetical protein C7403_106190 [Paraburkholderia caballeronis]PXX00599.1 hypothetical protein C7407_106190 [Paraburkholderia caballeronis]RAJ98662.1 hypothetical protein C7409_106190 [Paraburkholderia caballeronis]SEE69521.1 hypothetical protein SAMN05445871_5799 [Paraburkholderia caballeronis]SEK28532.1 hypothetical protein SAMN05192542_101445 [Paraburkholderia caballeronis]
MNGVGSAQDVVAERMSINTQYARQCRLAVRRQWALPECERSACIREHTATNPAHPVAREWRRAACADARQRAVAYRHGRIRTKRASSRYGNDPPRASHPHEHCAALHRACAPALREAARRQRKRVSPRYAPRLAHQRIRRVADELAQPLHNPLRRINDDLRCTLHASAVFLDHGFLDSGVPRTGLRTSFAGRFFYWSGESTSRTATEWDEPQS